MNAKQIASEIQESIIGDVFVNDRNWVTIEVNKVDYKSGFEVASDLAAVGYVINGVYDYGFRWMIQVTASDTII